MNNTTLFPEIYENFRVFHTMCLSSALISTYNSTDADSDSRRMFEFIGEAFGIEADLIRKFGDCILGDMMNIGLFTDYQAIASSEYLSDNDKDNIELYEIKGRILEKVAVAEAHNYNLADLRTSNQIKANMKYEYFHHPYNGKLRFFQLENLSENGNVDITRQVAVMYTLGIGCGVNFRKAEEKFLQCILWGDIVSAQLIAALYKKEGKQDPGFIKIFSDEEDSSTDSCISQYRSLIKLIRTFIIAPKKDPLINSGLAEILISDSLTFSEKAELIMNFNEKNLRNIFTLSFGQENHTGFRVKKDE